MFGPDSPDIVHIHKRKQLSLLQGLYFSITKQLNDGFKKHKSSCIVLIIGTIIKNKCFVAALHLHFSHPHIFSLSQDSEMCNFVFLCYSDLCLLPSSQSSGHLSRRCDNEERFI